MKRLHQQSYEPILPVNDMATRKACIGQDAALRVPAKTLSNTRTSLLVDRN
jgi:hypothetical protein